MTWPTHCIQRHEPLANHTSFRIGGPADWFARPDSLKELLDVLRQARRLSLPVHVLGGGTNTLAPDRGLSGVVIHLGRAFRRVEVRSPASPSAKPKAASVRVSCGAALLTQRLVYLAAQHGWGELEMLAGLPGQLGGAVTMNAQSIGRFVHEVTLVTLDGSVHRLPREALEFAYRYTALEPGIIAGVEFEFPKVPAEDAAAAIRRALQYRNATQELRLPSAGCAFKNPPGISAGRLLDEAGLKGCRIGDAQFSSRHANFITNLGRATCDDVLSLMEYAQRRVRRGVGVLLEPEVRLIGERVR